MTLKEKLNGLPDKPGVYIMYDKKGTVIYVGKAVILSRRVRQYFNNSPKQAKVAAMVASVETFEYIITLSEKDALSLEANLIRKYKPYYNILLKDDKASPYIRIDHRQDFPTIEVTRRLKKDGAKYFGPYMNGIRVWDIVAIIRSCYAIRTCKKSMPKKICLNYHLGLCSGPCESRVTKEQYSAQLEKVYAFLGGKEDSAYKIIEKKMMDAAAMEQFEAAIGYRNQLEMLNLLKKRNIADLGKVVDIDAFSYSFSGFYGAASVNIIRGGKMMGVRNYTISDASLDEHETLLSFIGQYYSGSVDIPDEVCLPFVAHDGFAQYLSMLKGSSVEVVCPQKGAKKRLVDMAEKNSADFLEKSVETEKHRHDTTVGASERLREILGLDVLHRMECYDISHVSGTDKVASGVVFVDGAPSRSDYRRYKIKTVEGSDDFACMSEVVSRRITRGKDENNLPDLIVIDGGKGQLSSSMDAMRSKGVNIPMVSLAERDEEIFVPQKKDPIVLAKDDYALRLLQRIRDEAHRFAITYHRNLRAKRMVKSYESIAGVGEVRRKLLQKHFSPEELKNATVEDIVAVGIDKRTAQNIVEHFKNKAD